MFEMYAFIAVFVVQIIVLSVLGPVRLVGFLRGQIAHFLAERAPQVDPSAVANVDRRLRLYRTLGLATSAVGLLLLGAMIRYMLRPDWTDGPLEAVLPAYWIVQVLPLFLAILTAGRFYEVLKRSFPAEKRKALLQPRGLFDFVSRSTVALAVLVYFVQMALLLYIERHPFPGFAGLLPNVGFLTLIYAAIALAIYVTLRKVGSSPLQALEDRMRSVAVAVRVCVYSCIVCVSGLSLNMTLVLLDQQRLEPTFMSIYLVVCALLCFVSMRAQLRIPGVDRPGAAALAR